MCAEESNGARHRVPDEACRNMRPKVQESCNSHDCPKWVTSEWSGVSLGNFLMDFGMSFVALKEIFEKFK